MAEAPLTADQQLQRILAAQVDDRLILPEIPFTPPSARLLAQVPELGRWYSTFHESMQRWREQLNQELTR